MTRLRQNPPKNVSVNPDAANIRAMQQIYVAAMLEELQLFRVMDRLVELFQAGVLPIGSNASGVKLYGYWKQRPQRMSTSERQSLYGRTLGLGGGDQDSTPNREFENLWLRFLSSVVSAADRSKNTDPAARRVSQQEVRKAGRDLAANLSLYGHGFAHFAAIDLQEQIKTITDLLSAPGVRAAYGAKNIWELIDKVASLELGGPPNIVRYRTMATSGSAVISWLASKVRDLARESGRPILGSQRRDRELIRACERWLAVQGNPGFQEQVT